MTRILLAGTFLSVLTLFSNQALAGVASELPSSCEFNKECLQESPGSLCGDATSSYYTLTVRPEAANLLIYLQGGGACWDFKSCTGGFAKNLTRVLPHNDWNGGTGIFNAKNELNPFRGDTVVTVPYCTGDVFSGTRDADYVSGTEKKRVRHQGYGNIIRMLDRVKALYPAPKRVVMIGESAGGMGAIFHLKNVAERFPDSRLYVLSDGGVPFKPPYLNQDAYKRLMSNWGAAFTRSSTNLSELIEENVKLYPDVRFGLIGSYFDYVMTFFAQSVGSSSAMKAVKNTLVDLSDHHIGLDRPNQRVFYFDDVKHVYLKKDLEGVQSNGENLADWLKAMLNQQELNWDNVRPDLHRELVGDGQPVAE